MNNCYQTSRSIVFSLLFYFCLLNPLLSNNGIGLGPILANGGGGLFFQLDENCEFEATLYVYLSNLEYYPPNTNNPSVYLFPTDHPPMYLSFKIADYPVQMFLLDEFNLYGFPNGISHFASEITSLPINLSSECLSSKAGSFPVDIEIKLMTLDQGQYIPYPACNYTANSEIFSCLAPWLDEDYCNTLPGCDNSYMTESNFPLDIFCNECTDSQSIWNNNSDRNQFGSSPVVEADVYPNPFKDELMVSCGFDDAIQQLELYDLRGALLLHRTFSEKDQINVDLNTIEIESGLYLLKVKTRQSTQTFKLLKSF